MTRNLKALGLALVAVFAMTAVLASAAQAQIKVTTGASPAWVTGSALPDEPVIKTKTHTFKLTGGQVLTCDEPTFTATVKTGDTSVTVVPTFDNCDAVIGPEKLKTTVTMNDCDFLFHGGKEVSSTTFSEGEVDIVCPEGKKIEIHVYKSPTLETEELCTYTVSPVKNLKGNEFHNVAGEKNDVTVTSTVGPVPVTRDGSISCGGASETATYTGTTTLKAFEHKGGEIKPGSGTVTGLVEGAQVSLTASK